MVCVDNERFYVERLSQRFGHLANLSFQELDLGQMENCSDLRHARLDTVICINVLEHIEDDAKVLRNFYNLLQPGGHALLLVPADPRLYTGVDRALGHYRRYTPQETRAKLEACGFEVVECRGFNRLGSLGWYVSGKWLRRTSISHRDMKLYEWLLPLAKLIEPLPLLPYLSVIAIGRKPLASAKPSSGDDSFESEWSFESRELRNDGISPVPV